MDGYQQSWGGKRQAGRVYNHILNDCDHADSIKKEKIAKATEGQTLHMQLKEAEGDGPLEKKLKVEGKKAHGLKVNQSVINLICGTGMPPTIVDTKEWQDLISMLDSSIRVYSSLSFADMYIPAEAAQVTEEAIQKLSQIKNLTISYDGGTTKAIESIYTIHVTTPKSQEAYLIEGSEKSGVSHMGLQITTELLKVSYITLISDFNFNLSLRLWIELANKDFQAYHWIVLGT